MFLLFPLCVKMRKSLPSRGAFSYNTFTAVAGSQPAGPGIIGCRGVVTGKTGMLTICTVRGDLPDGVAELELTGNLDACTFEALDNALLSLFEQGIYQVLVNLAGLGAISSAGAGTLLASHEQAYTKGGALVLHSIPETIMKTLLILGLVEEGDFRSHRLTVASGRKNALEMLNRRVECDRP